MVFIWTGLFSFYKITNETNTAEYIHTPSKAVPTDVSADTFNDYIKTHYIPTTLASHFTD